jgi:hypothetical protein
MIKTDATGLGGQLRIRPGTSKFMIERKIGNRGDPRD